MGRKVFLAVDVIVILLLCLICMVPLLNLLAYSFSASQPIIENKVFLWPKEFTLKAYQYVLESKEFWSSVSVSVKRVLLGVPLNTLLTILVAYPLSKDERQFKARKYYVAYMLTVMLFNGGLMPTYYIVSKTKLIDTVWALIIPGAVPILQLHRSHELFPRDPVRTGGIGKAGRSQPGGGISWRIFLSHIQAVSGNDHFVQPDQSNWNSWFDGLIYSDHTTNYPLQSYLQTLVTSTTEILAQGDVKAISKVSGYQRYEYEGSTDLYFSHPADADLSLPSEIFYDRAYDGKRERIKNETD